MDPLDVPKTMFMSNHGNYYYHNAMPFSRKNYGSTFQGLMDDMFSHHIERDMEVYVYDMIVKTTEGHNNAMDLEDILQSIRKYNMRLNPAK